VETSASFALAESYGGYTTNLPLEDLLDGKAWVAFRFGGQDLEPIHGGPARLLVPHLYFWKSAKWVRGIRLMNQDEPGFWESLGYHNYGDPWREQRYWGDRAGGPPRSWRSATSRPARGRWSWTCRTGQATCPGSTSTYA
jgi:DMSO/TMAO reductase YedYZ molybdopterin-dependent catalytic subunit